MYHQNFKKIKTKSNWNLVWSKWGSNYFVKFILIVCIWSFIFSVMRFPSIVGVWGVVDVNFHVFIVLGFKFLNVCRRIWFWFKCAWSHMCVTLLILIVLGVDLVTFVIEKLLVKNWKANTRIYNHNGCSCTLTPIFWHCKVYY